MTQEKLEKLQKQAHDVVLRECRDCNRAASHSPTPEIVAPVLSALIIHDAISNIGLYDLPDEVRKVATALSDIDRTFENAGPFTAQ